MTATSISPEQATSYNVNNNTLNKYPWIKQYLTFENSVEYYEGLKELQEMNLGGFEHGDLSGIYSKYQDDPRYCSTRFQGWQSLLSLLFEAFPIQGSVQDNLVIDCLAGSGTLSKRLKQLFKPEFLPKVIGLDVSSRMCTKALASNETVLWGSYKCNRFKLKVADVAIAAYGFHHVPYRERSSYVNAMHKFLKDQGSIIIHDFDEETNTAKWYSEVIHKFRPEGHDFPHVTAKSLTHLLSEKFTDIKIKRLYDPFYLIGREGQDEASLKREFFGYLIGMFNLKKLIPSNVRIQELMEYQSKQYWDSIEELLVPYFSLKDYECEIAQEGRELDTMALEKVAVPFSTDFKLVEVSTNQLSIIAPRTAMVGIGYKR